MSAPGKISAALTTLILEQPFFGALAMSLKMVPDPTCKTAWVNGRDLGYNPTFVESLSHAQVTALLAHEVMHCALGHPWRRDGRDLKGFNIAADKAINGDLRESFTLPDGVLYPEGDEVGKSAEWIYARMGENQPPTPQPVPQPETEPEPDEDGQESPGDEDGDGEPTEDENGEPGDEDGDSEGDGDGDPDGDESGDGDGEGDGNGQGEPDPLGELRDAPTGPDEDGEPSPTEDEWKQNAASAMQQAKAMGKMPGGMARLVERAIKSTVDKRSLLLRFFSERSTGDYSWTRPNPRYVSHGLYLPALESRDLGEVAIMVDTSGSMDSVALSNARNQVESVMEECNPSRVSMYYADAQVQHVDYFDKGEPLIWPGPDTHIGGGGTDFRPALEAIERDELPVCVICITDLYGCFPDVAPNIPVLWLSTTEGLNAPFGETVYIDE